MRKLLDTLDLKILEALGIYGPRNILTLAKTIQVPVTTVRDRIRSLRSHLSLYLRVSIYHTFIGLKKVFVFAKATPGHERSLWKALKTNGYWLYLTAIYGKPESFYGIYGIPIEKTEQFHLFIDEIKKSKLAQSISLHWSTCIQTINLSNHWYDNKMSGWVFKWDKWINDIGNRGTNLPPTLSESVSYPQKADRIDIIILKELQKTADCKLSSIAKLLGISPQVVQYHFRNHVIAKGLIEGYEVSIPHFEVSSDVHCFRFNFDDEKKLAGFALSLLNKPFARSVTKIYGEDGLFSRIYLPRKQFRGFTDSLGELIRYGMLRNYDYVIEDPSRSEAQTIPYELFQNNSWVYDHSGYLRKIHGLDASIGA